MNTTKSDTSQETELATYPVHGESDKLVKKRKAKIFFWAILWAIFPPALIVGLLIAVVKPAIRGREPDGINYILWILGLILLATIFYLPFGSVNAIFEALQNAEVCRALLLSDAIATIISIFLIIFTFRKRKIPNPYIPINKFKVDKPIVILWFLSLLPLVRLFLPRSSSHDPGNIGHPLIIAFTSSLQNGFYYSLVVGFLSFGLFGPVLEELIFRGLLLEQSHERDRSKAVRYLLDFAVCIFFAALHLPVSFVVPLILATAFLYVRRHSGSLLPSIVMHASWNTSILMTILLVGYL
jgi:membrane protease YdiL (CAAX protease family)